MAYKAYFGTFAKHENSTKQPSYTSWASFDVVFKNGADISKPVISLSTDLDSVSAFNYAVLLNRFYWIREKRMERSGLCIMQLDIDPMATWKTEIGSSSLYILRSSAASDGTIPDRYYSIKSAVNYSTEIKQPFGPVSYNNGFYVVNVMGTGSTGNSTLWKMSPSKFRTFINGLYTNIDGFQFQDVAEVVLKLAGGQPEKLVSSAMWFPAGVSFAAGNAENVIVGGWDSGVQANMITDPIFTDYVHMTIAPHPQAATRGSYLNLSPYTMYYLTIPMFGTISLDTSLLIGSSEIVIESRIDAVSGSVVAEITPASSSRILASLSGQMGVTLPLAGQSSGANIVTGAASTAAAAVGAFVTGGASAIAGAITSGIGTAVSAITGATSSTGSSGNIIAPSKNWILDSVYYTIMDEDNARNGRPLCQVRTPASLGGFMIAQKGDIEAAAPLPELLAIKNYLETGFYYE